MAMIIGKFVLAGISWIWKSIPILGPLALLFSAIIIAYLIILGEEILNKIQMKFEISNT